MKNKGQCVCGCTQNQDGSCDGSHLMKACLNAYA